MPLEAPDGKVHRPTTLHTRRGGRRDGDGAPSSCTAGDGLSAHHAATGFSRLPGPGCSRGVSPSRDTGRLGQSLENCLQSQVARSSLGT